MMHTGLRSGKVNLEKLRRSRSESDSTYDESVTLESVTDLEHKKESDSSVGLSQLQCQEVQLDCLVYGVLWGPLRKWWESGVKCTGSGM